MREATRITLYTLHSILYTLYSTLYMIDFKLASKIMEAKRYAKHVPRLVGMAALNPAPLNMAAPIRDNASLQLCHLLATSNKSLVEMLRGWALSYAKAGMAKGLCEYAACRDTLERLAALEARCKESRL